MGKAGGKVKDRERAFGHILMKYPKLKRKIEDVVRDTGKTAQMRSAINDETGRDKPGFLTMRDIKALAAVKRDMIATVTCYMLTHRVDDH